MSAVWPRRPPMRTSRRLPGAAPICARAKPASAKPVRATHVPAAAPTNCFRKALRLRIVFSTSEASFLEVSVPRILADDVREVLVVLVADVLHQLVVVQIGRVAVQGERLGIRSRILDSDFVI